MNLWRFVIVSLFFSWSLLAYSAPMVSVNTDNQENSEQTYVAKDSFGRDNPRSMWQDFMKALASDDIALASKYLDDEYLKQKGIDDAQVLEKLKRNLDAGAKLTPMLQISDKSEGNTEDLLANNQDKIGEIIVNGQKTDILLTQKKTKEGVIYWQISKDTLSKLPDLSTQNTLAQKLTDKGLSNITLMNFNLADIVALALVIVGTVVACYIAMWLLFGVLKVIYPIITRRQFLITPRVIMPLSVVLMSLVLPHVMLWAGVPLSLRSPMESAKQIVAWIATTWLIFRSIDATFKRAENSSIKRNRPEQVSFLRLLRRLVKAFMLMLAIIIIFGNLGFDLTTGIAALGIGGGCPCLWSPKKY